MTEKFVVKAIYKFKGTNNDELVFDKNALITVTQREDGGWWEGTLDGKTGWFPSNYVIAKEPENVSYELSPEILTRQIDSRQVVLKDIVNKEREFVADIKCLLFSYLNPLHRSELLTESEFKTLIGNLEELYEVHRCFHDALEEISKLKSRDQKLGKVFLEHGASFKNAHMVYWANHPKAVIILEKYREELDSFMEDCGASKPGHIFLTSYLSKPFRILEKYGGVIQEIETHTEDDHSDRGDTQRSIGFIKNIVSECAKIRRQKEMELEILHGTIKGWEGDEDLKSLGDILYLGSVAVGSEHKDRHFVLFSSYLLLLSVSSRMSAFIYEGKLPLSGISVNRLEDVDTIKNSFEITGPMIDRILVTCQTKSDSLQWVEVLKAQIKASRMSLPHPPPHKTQHGHLMNLPLLRVESGNERSGRKYIWKSSCLRPSPPTRSFLTHDGRRRTIIKKKDYTYDEDMQILRVIEAYCTSGKARQTYAASAFIENLPVLLADDEVSCKNSRPRSSIQKEDKGFLESFESLKENVYSLKEQIKLLSRKLEDEASARKKLEALVQSSSHKQQSENLNE